MSAQRKRPEVTLAPGEIRALVDLAARHPHTRVIVTEVRDDGDVGWVLARFDERTDTWPYSRVTEYRVSPSGRAWLSAGDVAGERVREADYDERSGERPGRERAGASGTARGASM